jgi:hypothetical protein
MMGTSSRVEVNRRTERPIRGFHCEHGKTDQMFNFFRSKRPVSPAPNVYLTKTNYIAGLQCPLRLWMRWHEPLSKDVRIETTAMRTGNRVGSGGRSLFRGGVLVDTMDHAKAFDQTRHLMANDAIPAIFEAALEHGNARVRVDVLERHAGGAWIINEVKALTKVKEWHIPDIAVQVWAARGMGLVVPAAKVIHVDPSYVRGASGIDWTRLFFRDDVTEQVTSYLEGLPATITEQLAVLVSDARPQIEPSSHCDKPHPCEFWERCTSKKPKDWIFHLPRIKADLFEELSAASVQRIGDIPDDASLNGLQARVRDCHRSGQPYVSRGLKQALKPITDEAWYFDLEAAAPAIPLWPGTHPYERIPFQWSLHRRRATGSIHHEEFLAEGRDDPRRAFAERLLMTINPGEVPIVIYSSYEQQVIDELACKFPDLSAQLLSLRERLFDLLPVVREHYYHVGFVGSFSIKSVGPTLAPDVDYAGLDGIAKGDEASEAFERLVTDSLKQGETPQQIRKGLLSYCKLDTLALLRVHEALTEAANAS